MNVTYGLTDSVLPLCGLDNPVSLKSASNRAPNEAQREKERTMVKMIAYKNMEEKLFAAENLQILANGEASECECYLQLAVQEKR